MNAWHAIMDNVYITRARAIELGATHEGTHFGIPHWAWMLDESGAGLMACPKLALLEPFITLCAIAHAFINTLRAPGEEQEFKFLLKPIDQQVKP